MTFIKSSVLTGLYVVLPLLLLGIGFAEIGGLLAAIVDPIADMFPSDYFDDTKWPGVLAALMITALFPAGRAGQDPFDRTPRIPL